MLGDEIHESSQRRLAKFGGASQRELIFPIKFERQLSASFLGEVAPFKICGPQKRRRQLHVHGFLAGLRGGLSVGDLHFNLPQQSYDLLRFVPLHRACPAPVQSDSLSLPLDLFCPVTSSGGVLRFLSMTHGWMNEALQRTETLAIPSAALAPDPIEKLSTPA